MVNESSPVQAMSAQRQTERGDEVIERLSRELERGGRSVADDSRIADAASWALEKATDALQSAFTKACMRILIERLVYSNERLAQAA